MPDLKCPYCGKNISEEDLKEIEEEEVFDCPFCGKAISTEDI